MVRKKRDHKAEYARRKARAKAAGYSGVTQYRRARKVLALPPRTSPVPKSVLERTAPDTVDRITITPDRRLRNESAAWSNTHSRVTNSQYDPSFSMARVRDYHKAFVDRLENLSRRKRAQGKRKNIYHYLVTWCGMPADKEWDEAWKSDLAPA